jgi:uncharacterized repeat protein (TIGR01451 family)
MLAAVFLSVAVVSIPAATLPSPAPLSFDVRVAAEKAIERIDPRYAFRPNETAALETYWKLSPTDSMLDRELARLARTIEPARLLAIYEALGNDPVLVKECLARPVLVDRLSRDLFAFDPIFHAEARDRAALLRGKLRSGELNPWADYPGRTMFKGPPTDDEIAGQVSPVEERRDAFVLFVVLSKTAREAVVATYVVPKRTFEDWWESARLMTSLQTLPTVAAIGDRLPGPSASTSCAPSHTDESADLFVLTYGDPLPVTVGELLTYTVILTNEGPDPANDAEILLLLPDATTFESVVPPDTGGTWDCVTPVPGGKGKVSCTNKCLAPHVPAFFTITVKVDWCAGGAPLQSTTIASSATLDPFPPNNVAATSIGVIDSGDCDDGSLCTSPDRCVPVPGFTENFDAVAAPRLPAGWTATLLDGPIGAKLWETAVTAWDTRPNAAFAPDAGDIRDNVLDSPEIPVLSSSAQLSFRNYYSLELGNDGGVLELKIGAGPFEDILEAGGSFVEGGYNGTISENFGSPIHGRAAWTGTVTHFIQTTVSLPPSAFGRTIVLRWRLGTDRSLGSTGQWIDSITVSDRQACLAGPPIVCDDGDACTADSCEPVNGCRHDPLSCDDGLPCTTDSCDPAVGCVHVALSCDDGNPCTDDGCTGLTCIHTNNSVPCNDGNACTLTDVCSGGTCTGSNAVVCLDGDVCTADACDPLLRCVATTANFDVTGFSASRVDGRDLAVLAGAWNSCPGNPRYTAAANLDRESICIDLADFHQFMNAFGRECP